MSRCLSHPVCGTFDGSPRTHTHCIRSHIPRLALLGPKGLFHDFFGAYTSVPALTTQCQDCASSQHPGPLGRPGECLHVTGHKLRVPEEYVHVRTEGTGPSCWLVLNMIGSSSYKLSHTNTWWW